MSVWGQLCDMAAIDKFEELLHAPIVPLLLYVFEANSFFQ